MIKIEMLEKRITFVNEDLQRMTNEMAEKIEILEKDIKTIKVINLLHINVQVLSKVLSKEATD